MTTTPAEDPIDRATAMLAGIVTEHIAWCQRQGYLPAQVIADLGYDVPERATWNGAALAVAGSWVSIAMGTPL